MNTTENLLAYLKNADLSQLSRYRETQLKGRVTDFRDYMNRLIKRSGRRRSEIFGLADIPENYGYKILSGEIHTGDRDRLIRILLTLRASLDEFQRALKLHSTAVLSPHSPRDSVIIFALYHKFYDINWINDMLRKTGEKPI